MDWIAIYLEHWAQNHGLEPTSFRYQSFRDTMYTRLRIRVNQGVSTNDASLQIARWECNRGAEPIHCESIFPSDGTSRNNTIPITNQVVPPPLSASEQIVGRTLFGPLGASQNPVATLATDIINSVQGSVPDNTITDEARGLVDRLARYPDAVVGGLRSGIALPFENPDLTSDLLTGLSTLMSSEGGPEFFAAGVVWGPLQEAADLAVFVTETDLSALSRNIIEILNGIANDPEVLRQLVHVLASETLNEVFDAMSGQIVPAGWWPSTLTRSNWNAFRAGQLFYPIIVVIIGAATGVGLAGAAPRVASGLGQALQHSSRLTDVIASAARRLDRTRRALQRRRNQDRRGRNQERDDLDNPQRNRPGSGRFTFRPLPRLRPGNCGGYRRTDNTQQQRETVSVDLLHQHIGPATMYPENDAGWAEHLASVGQHEVNRMRERMNRIQRQEGLNTNKNPEAVVSRNGVDEVWDVMVSSSGDRINPRSIMGGVWDKNGHNMDNARDNFPYQPAGVQTRRVIINLDGIAAPLNASVRRMRIWLQQNPGWDPPHGKRILMVKGGRVVELFSRGTG